MKYSAELLQGTNREVGPFTIGILGAGFDEDGVGVARIAVVVDGKKTRALLSNGQSAVLGDGSIVTVVAVTRPSGVGGRPVVEVAIGDEDWS